MTPTITATAETAGVGALRDLLDGELVTPRDPAWDEARGAWNLAADQRPAAVVLRRVGGRCRRRRRLCPRQRAPCDHPGHRPLRQHDRLLRAHDPAEDRPACAASRSTAESRTARAEAGVALAGGQPRGDRARPGRAGRLLPDVGVVGYTLGGGLGWLGRRYGLAANSVLAVELVTADGTPRARRPRQRAGPLLGRSRRRRQLRHRDRDRVRPLSRARGLRRRILFFPFERSAEILNAWREWAEDTPREVTSAGRLMQFPPIPQVPEPLRGQSFVLVEAVVHRVRGGRRGPAPAAPRARPRHGHLRA